VTVSVTRDAGALSVPKGAYVIIGARDASGWASILNDENVKAGLLGVIDATHPFAALASREIVTACEGTETPLCRFVRPVETPPKAIIAPGVENAIDRAIKQTSGSDVIFLTLGTNDLGIVMPRIRKAGRGVLVRMLPTVRSIKQAKHSGLTPMEIVAAWGAGGTDFNAALCRERNVKCIVSRESGAHGHMAEKAEAARELGIPLILITRPPEPEGVTRVGGFDKLLEWCGELASCDKK
jgi:precorrin-6A/cobalt-precorrin-6A reductase